MLYHTDDVAKTAKRDAVTVAMLCLKKLGIDLFEKHYFNERKQSSRKNEKDEENKHKGVWKIKEGRK